MPLEWLLDIRGQAIYKTRENGGEEGIRTLGTLARTTVFETAPFDRSGTSPPPCLGQSGNRRNNPGAAITRCFHEPDAGKQQHCIDIRLFSLTFARSGPRKAAQLISQGAPRLIRPHSKSVSCN